MIRGALCLLVCLLVIGFSCLSASTVSAVYGFVGGAVGVSPEWIKLYLLTISDYGHLVAYALLTFLVGAGCWIRLRYVFVLIVAFGAAMEIMQIWIPKRQGSFSDLGFDIAGIVLGSVLLMFLQKMRASA